MATTTRASSLGKNAAVPSQAWSIIMRVNVGATRRAPWYGSGRGRRGRGVVAERGETGGVRVRAREDEANRQRRWLRATAAFVLSARRRGRRPLGISAVRLKRKFLSGSTRPLALNILREKIFFSRRPRKFCENPNPPCNGQFLHGPTGSRLFLHFKALKKRKC